MRAIILDAGDRFDMLVTVERISGSGENTRWRCHCDCGSECVVSQRMLRRTTKIAGAKSCGCFRKSPAFASHLSSKMTRHGHCRKMQGTKRSPLWIVWMGIRQRCANPRNRAWSMYGGRGIVMCQRWMDSFEAFVEDMGSRPPGTSIDRIDPNGHYEPGNCRWATDKEQGRNKRSVRLTWDLVQEIHGRREHGEPTKSIAARMGITDNHARNIIAGRVWKDAKQWA